MAATQDRLSRAEGAFVALPTAAGFVFGLAPLLIPTQFAVAGGFPGNDAYIYRLAGAATLGYGVGLALALREGRWMPSRPLVAATLTFNLASLFACGVEIAAGTATWIVYLIAAASLLFVTGTTWLLVRRRSAAPTRSDIGRVFTLSVAALAAVALIVGMLPIAVPVQFGHFFGLKATDVFLYRQAGAATVGYAVLGAVMLASRRASDIRFGVVMALVFNGAALLVSVIYAIAGGANFAPLVVGAAALLATAACVFALTRPST